MAIWYRACIQANAKIAFSGEGGLYTAGRWHHRGTKVIYCSESIALCTLEWLAHQGISAASFTYCRYSIDIPDQLIARYTLKDLPAKWNATPATGLTRDFAEEKLFSMSQYIAIALPSVMVPEEFNLVINPAHQAFLTISKTIRFLGKHLAPKR